MSCMKDKRELRSLGMQVEAALGCPEANAAAEEGERLASLRAEHEAILRGSVPKPSLVEVTQASQAMDFDGDCEAFRTFANQVVAKCSMARCCADVVADDECRYYAAGLHALFPSGAINHCAREVKLDSRCTCFVRHASACAVQAEVHE